MTLQNKANRTPKANSPKDRKIPQDYANDPKKGGYTPVKPVKQW